MDDKLTPMEARVMWRGEVSELSAIADRMAYAISSEEIKWDIFPESLILEFKEILKKAEGLADDADRLRLAWGKMGR